MYHVPTLPAATGERRAGFLPQLPCTPLLLSPLAPAAATAPPGRVLCCTSAADTHHRSTEKGEAWGKKARGREGPWWRKLNLFAQQSWRRRRREKNRLEQGTEKKTLRVFPEETEKLLSMAGVTTFERKENRTWEELLEFICLLNLLWMMQGKDDIIINSIYFGGKWETQMDPKAQTGNCVSSVTRTGYRTSVWGWDTKVQHSLYFLRSSSLSETCYRENRSRSCHLLLPLLCPHPPSSKLSNLSQVIAMDW